MNLDPEKDDLVSYNSETRRRRAKDACQNSRYWSSQALASARRDVPEYGGLLHGKWLNEFVHRCFAFCKAGEDCASGWIGKGGERCVE